MTAFEGHTPGPWRVVDDISGNHYCPRGKDARPPAPCPCDFTAEGSWSLEGPPHTGWVGDHDTSLARRVDAELAAAAPDLLAILRHMLDGFDWNGPYGGWSVWDRVRDGVDDLTTELTPEQVALLSRLALPEVPREQG